MCVRGEREMCGIVHRIAAELVYLLNVSVAEVGWSFTGYRVKLNQPWQPRYFESQASHIFDVEMNTLYRFETNHSYRT